MALPVDTKLMILAPVVANRKGEQVDLFAELRAQGVRVLLGAGVAIRGPRAATAAPMTVLHPHVQDWAIGHALRGPADHDRVGTGAGQHH